MAVLALQGAPKLKVAIVGSGLAGLSTAVELLDQGYEVDVFESRAFIGGKVASWQKDGNHVEMGLHVVRHYNPHPHCGVAVDNSFPLPLAR